MTREEIAATLKELRISSGKTQKEVAEILGRKQQIVGHWETGYSQPDANTLFTLCDIYGTTVDEAFGFKKEEVSITKKDIDLLQRFHSLDAYGQETINYMINRELNRTIHSSPTSPAAQLRIYTYMQKIASAGTGFYFEDIPTDTIEAPYKDGADFIIGVSGDSMEPTFFDGDLLYVSKQQTVKTGEIGIFIVNNECFVKEAGENELISHNPEAKNIPGTEDIVCVGKVLGKVEK